MHKRKFVFVQVARLPTLRQLNRKLLLDIIIIITGLSFISSEKIAKLVNRKDGSVTHAVIQTDAYLHTKGSCRIWFASRESYYCAVSGSYIDIKTETHKKKVQVEPFIDFVRKKCNRCLNLTNLSIFAEMWSV